MIKRDKIKQINSILIDICKQQNHSLNLNIDDCEKILDNSKNLNDLLGSIFYESIDREELEILTNEICYTIIELYLDKNNIEIIEKDVIDEYNEDIKSGKYNGQDLSSITLYMLDVTKYKSPTADEITALFINLKEHPENEREIKKEIVNKNQRLVLSIAKKYCQNYEQLLDKIQDGNIGLLRAIELFDVTRGYKFSTYATYWIKQNITRSISNYSKIIRIPVHAYEKFIKIKKTTDEYYKKNGIQPTNEQIGKILNMSESDVLKLKRVSLDPISLSSYVGDEEDTELGDMIEDSKALSPEQEALRTKISDDINEAMMLLDEREREIIKRRNGFDTGIPETLEEIGTDFGVTRERIRQIESKALRKLKNNRKLRTYDRQ